MKILPQTMSIIDYCKDLRENEIRVNREYQRSAGVWPTAARSFLIETILRGYPIPKLFLHQVTDVRTRTSYKEVVDGQQRTKVIRDFFDNKLRLSSKLELSDAKGKRFDQLPDDLQERFLEYGLSFDVFVATTEKEVREVFRRMNSFTVPLNAEEHRHAVYQGPFKWFIYRLGTDYEDGLLGAGVFSPRQILRMADSKLLSEVVHAVLNGIETTDRKKLDDMYKDRDEEFSEEKALNAQLRGGLDRFLSWDDISGSALTKPYNVYALLLAAIHIAKPVETLVDSVPGLEHTFLQHDAIIENLLTLSDQLEMDQPDNKYRVFADAAAERTNVAEQRKIRFQWFCCALTDRLP